MHLIRPLLALLLLLVGARLAAADVPSIDELKGGRPSTQVAEAADQPLIDDRRHDLTRLRGVSPAVGAVLLLLAAIPLFAGWRLLRLAIGVLSGAFAAMWAWQYGLPIIAAIAGGGAGGGEGTRQLALVVFAASAFVIGFLLGWALYKLQLGLAGALLGLMALSLPGIYLDWPWLTVALMAVGAVLGFIAGWIAAPYWAALQTALLGGFFVVQGVAILAQQMRDEDQLRLLAYGAGLGAGLVGLAVQAMGIARGRGGAVLAAHPSH